LIHIKLKKSETSGGSFVGIAKGTGIKELNSAFKALVGTVGVTVTEEVDRFRNFSRKDMDEMKYFPLTFEGASGGIVKIEIVVPENDFEVRGERSSLIEDRFTADIAEVPDLVDPF
jgi:hypothetical protein